MVTGVETNVRTGLALDQVPTAQQRYAKTYQDVVSQRQQTYAAGEPERQQAQAEAEYQKEVDYQQSIQTATPVSVGSDARVEKAPTQTNRGFSFTPEIKYYDAQGNLIRTETYRAVSENGQRHVELMEVKNLTTGGFIKLDHYSSDGDIMYSGLTTQSGEVIKKKQYGRKDYQNKYRQEYTGIDKVDKSIITDRDVNPEWNEQQRKAYINQQNKLGRFTPEQKNLASSLTNQEQMRRYGSVLVTTKDEAIPKEQWTINKQPISQKQYDILSKPQPVEANQDIIEASFTGNPNVVTQLSPEVAEKFEKALKGEEVKSMLSDLYIISAGGVPEKSRMLAPTTATEDYLLKDVPKFYRRAYEKVAINTIFTPTGQDIIKGGTMAVIDVTQPFVTSYNLFGKYTGTIVKPIGQLGLKVSGENKYAQGAFRWMESKPEEAGKLALSGLALQSFKIPKLVTAGLIGLYGTSVYSGWKAQPNIEAKKMYAGEEIVKAVAFSAFSIPSIVQSFTKKVKAQNILSQLSKEKPTTIKGKLYAGEKVVGYAQKSALIRKTPEIYIKIPAKKASQFYEVITPKPTSAVSSSYGKYISKKVTPEQFAKSLLKSGKLAEIQYRKIPYYENPNAYGWITRDKVPTIVIESRLPKTRLVRFLSRKDVPTQREVLRHELTHFIQGYKRPKEMNKFNFNSFIEREARFYETKPIFIRTPKLKTYSFTDIVTRKQYTTTIYTPKKTTYYIRSLTEKGLTTTKVFQKDKLLGTFKTEAKPMFKFTEPIKQVARKEYISLPELRLERQVKVSKAKSVSLTNDLLQPKGELDILTKDILRTETKIPSLKVLKEKPTYMLTEKGWTLKRPEVLSYIEGKTKYRFVKYETKPKPFKEEITPEGRRYTQRPVTSLTTQNYKTSAQFEIRFEPKLKQSSIKTGKIKLSKEQKQFENIIRKNIKEVKLERKQLAKLESLRTKQLAKQKTQLVSIQRPQQIQAFKGISKTKFYGVPSISSTRKISLLLPISRTKQETKQLQETFSLNITKQEQKQRQDILNKQLNLQENIQQNKQIQRQEQRQLQRQIQQQQQMQQQIQMQQQLQQQQQLQLSLKIKKRITPIIPPTIPINRGSSEYLFGGNREQAYNVLVKLKQLKAKKGKYIARGYKKVNTQPLTREAALGMGAGIVDTYANRSFKIEKARGIANQRFDLQSQWASLQGKFRVAKKNPNVLVEKSKYAIDNRTEVKQIPYEAIRQRRGGLWF